MSDDLVKRLNEDFSSSAREDIQYQMEVYEKERKEAADRIEKLEAALRKIDRSSCLNPHDICNIARKALLEGKDD